MKISIVTEMNLDERKIHQLIKTEIITREEALELASKYGLRDEVEWCMDFCGFTPEGALYEWDLL